MALAFNCPECGSELLVKYLKVGEKAKCNSCGATPMVPENARTVDEVRRWPDQRLPSQKLREDSQLGVSTSRTPLFAIGGILLVVGIIGLVAVYSLRPPSGFGEALMMEAQGRHQFIREPLYQILMAVFGLISLFGIIQIVRGMSADKDIKNTVSRLATPATTPKLPTTDPKNITLGQSIEEVEGVLGKPDKKIELGTKVTYIYPDIKIIFVDGKVSDAQ